MAKKEKAASATTALTGKAALDALIAGLSKSIGDNDEAQGVTEFLNTGFPPLNKVMSGRYDGGLPYGRLMEVFGGSSTGKTALITDWMIRAQQAGGCAIFIDWEKSFDVEMAVAQGLNTERPYWIYMRPETWEEGNEMATTACDMIRKSGVIPAEAPIFCGFDSIASAIPHSVLYDKNGNRRPISTHTMNDNTALARVAAQTLKLQALYCAENNAIFCYLNQIRTKPGEQGAAAITTPGGSAMEFYATVRLSLSREIIKDDKTKEVEAQDIRIYVKKSKLTAPFRTTHLRLGFEEDGMAVFDKGYSLVDTLCKKKLIELNGARIDWKGKSIFKSQLGELAQNDPAVYEELSAKLVDVGDDGLAEPEDATPAAA